LQDARGGILESLAMQGLLSGGFTSPINGTTYVVKAPRKTSLVGGGLNEGLMNERGVKSPG